MDWVHCNMCYAQPGDVKGKKFSITNCGHIYCSECLESGELEECHICHVKYNSIPLTAKMTPEVESYFHDPIQNIQKQVRILEFQQSHRIRLVAYNKTTAFKIQNKEICSLKDELKRLREQYNSLQKEFRRAKEAENHYKKKLEHLARYSQSKRPQQPPMGRFTPNTTHISPRLSFYSQGHYSGGEDNQGGRLKRPPLPSEFLSSAKSSQKDDGLFATPTPPRKFPGSYRNIRNTTPDQNSPLTPDSITTDYSQRDPLQRRIKLPGDKGGPSPTSRIGLHRLSLSKSTSTPVKENHSFNKYSKYF